MMPIELKLYNGFETNFIYLFITKKLFHMANSNLPQLNVGKNVKRVGTKLRVGKDDCVGT